MNDRKIVQIVNNRVFWITDMKTLEQALEMYPLDVLFVEAPDYVTTEWGYDPTQIGDDRFTEPVPPEGFFFDRESGNMYPNEMKEVLFQQEYTKKQQENKEKLAAWLGANPITWKDGKKYGITFDDQSEISLNLQQYQLQCTIRENQERMYKDAMERKRVAEEDKENATVRWDAATAEVERRKGLTEEEAAEEQKRRDEYKESLIPHYQTDEEGNQILDEAGRPILEGYYPPVYQKDANGNVMMDDNGDPIVLEPMRQKEPEPPADPMPLPLGPDGEPIIDVDANVVEGDGETEGEEAQTIPTETGEYVVDESDEVPAPVDPNLPDTMPVPPEGGMVIIPTGEPEIVPDPDPYGMRMKDDPFEDLIDPDTIEIPVVEEPTYIRPILQWHAIHEACVDWNVEDLTQLAAAITAKVYPALNLMYCFKEQIYAFKTKDEIRAFNPDYRVLDPSDLPPMPPEWLPGEGPDAEETTEAAE